MNDTQMGTEQKVTRKEAVTMYTLNGAYLTFEEEVRGSIDTGKPADLVVLSEDLLTCHSLVSLGDSPGRLEKKKGGDSWIRSGCQ